VKPYYARSRAVSKAEFASRLRANMSYPEQILWDRRAEIGVRMNRQQLLFGYIADFYFPSRRSILEVDGRQHDDRWDYDERRDNVFVEREFHVLRMEARVVIRYPAVAIDVIRDWLNAGESEQAWRAWAEVTEFGVRCMTQRGRGNVEHYDGVVGVDAWHMERDCPGHTAEPQHLVPAPLRTTTSCGK
jgi:very-short-patch-repair endonuclease